MNKEGNTKKQSDTETEKCAIESVQKYRNIRVQHRKYTGI